MKISSRFLDFEFAYLEQIGLTDENMELCGYPLPVNEDELEEYIISECAKIGVNLISNEVEEILDAELIYLKKLGLIEDEGMEQFYN